MQLYQSDSFQVVIEAVVGDGYQGDIAIDDVTFTPDCMPTGIICNDCYLIRFDLFSVSLSILL